MKIKMLRNVVSNSSLKGGQSYDLPDAEAQSLVDAGYAVKEQAERETAASKQAANRETASKGNKPTE